MQLFQHNTDMGKTMVVGCGHSNYTFSIVSAYLVSRFFLVRKKSKKNVLPK